MDQIDPTHVLRPSDVARALVGQAVLDVTADPRSGVLLQLGRWVPLRRKLDNPNLREKAKTHRGTHSVFITCPWVWRQTSKPAGASERALPPDDSEVQWSALADLVRASVTSACFDRPGLEMMMVFDHDLALQALPLQGNEMQHLSIGLNGTYWNVNSSGGIAQSAL